MEHQGMKESLSSTEEITTRSHHVKNSSSLSSSSSSSSEEDFLQFEATELRSSGLGKENMKLPSPELPEQNEVRLDTEIGIKDCLMMDADTNRGLIVAKQTSQNELSDNIQAECRLMMGASSISAFDDSAKNKDQMDLKVEESEEGKCSHSQMRSIVNHSEVCCSHDSDERRSYMGFVKESLLSQATGKTATYNPDRIPSSVFSKPQSPTDWSVASNESMFSIHFGSLSFSRDHILNLGMSGESKVTPDHDPGLAPKEALPFKETTSIIHEEPSIPGIAMMEENVEAGVSLPITLPVPRTASMARHSDDSGTSVQSFAFPILTADVNSKSVKLREEPPAFKPPETKHEEDRGWFSCWWCSCPSCC